MADSKATKRRIRPVNPHHIESIFKNSGPKAVVDFVREGIRSKEDGGMGLDPLSFSVKELALAMGIIDPYRQEESFRSAMALGQGTERFDIEHLLHESNPGVNTNAFQVATGELIMSRVSEGYEDYSDFIGDQLVENMPNQKLRNQKIVGMTSLAGPSEVLESRPYEESGFEEKFVTTLETKKGRILSINEELILFDQTPEILRRAKELGFYTRQERERVIIRGVTEADATNEPVYRPSGTAATLYNTDGSNFNFIGVGNTTSTSFNAAIALQDWTDIDEIMTYRATEVKDDRIDGTTRHIAGLNGPNNILLVPWNLKGTANYIINATEVRVDVTNQRTMMRNPVNLEPALASAFIDEQGGDALNDYFFGDFKRQFKWFEIWPVQTFTQGANSEAQFERDVAFRIKVRYYGGLSAIDTKYVTKIDGA